MHRPTVGILALVLMSAWLVGQVWTPPSDGWQNLLVACWRVGLVLGVLWLALPQTRALPNKLLLVAILLGALLLVLRPKLLPLLLVALIVFAILRPRRSRKAGKRG